MMHKREDREFLETLAPTSVGRDLIRLLENIEMYYADIRNLDVPAEVRIEALKILREALLDKLIILSGSVESPEQDEHV